MEVQGKEVTEEWVLEGGGWKKKKVFGEGGGGTSPVMAASSVKNAVKSVQVPAESFSVVSVNRAVAVSSVSAPSKSKQLYKVQATTRQTPTTALSTPKKASRFNPTFPSTSTTTTPSTPDTPDTAALTPETAETPNEGGEEDAHHCTTIPLVNIRMIQAAFGENADLYTEVLAVESPQANEREIRIAYFRRGRQVLEQSQQQDTSVSSASIADLSILAKQRFQAVSMAYEILSQPSSKRLYDRVGIRGLLKFAVKTEAEEPLLPQVYPKQESPTVRRRRTQSFEDRTAPNTPRQGRRSGRTPAVATTTPLPSAVRWSENVEELVFDQDPEERAFKSSVPEPDKRRNKFKKNVLVVDNGGQAPDLVKNFERLDQAATSNVFVAKFLDDVEQSLEDIEVGFDDFVKYLSDGEGDDEDASPRPKRMTRAKSKSAVVASPAAEASSTASGQPKRRTQSRIMAAMQAFENPSTSTADAKKENFIPLIRRHSIHTAEVDTSRDTSQDVSQDADELFATLMKTAPIVKSEGPEETHRQLKSAQPSLPPSKIDTPHSRSNRLKKMSPSSLMDLAMPIPLRRDGPLEHELGESFLPPGGSDGAAKGPANMLIRTKSKKAITHDSDSVSAITESTNMPKSKERHGFKLSNGGPTLDRVLEVEEEFPTTKPSILNTTIDTDVFSGVEDDPLNTTTISDSGKNNVDFLSYFMAYMKNLSTDMYAVGSRVNQGIETTNRMFFDSILISDEDMQGMLAHLNHELPADEMTISRAQTF